MSKISGVLPGLARDAADGAGTASPLQRRSWQRALEENGLQSALEGVRRFSAQPARSQPSGLDVEAASPAKRQQADGAVLGRGKDGIEPAPARSTMRVQPEAGLLAGDALISRNTGLREMPIVAPMHAYRDSIAGSHPVPADGEPSTLPELAPFSGGGEPLSTMWKERRIMVLQSDDGVELWLRDAQLTEEEAQSLLSVLTSTLSERGLTLSRAALNGKIFYTKA